MMMSEESHRAIRGWSLAALALAGLLFAFSTRYKIIGAEYAYRLDTWTGGVVFVAGEKMRESKWED